MIIYMMPTILFLQSLQTSTNMMEKDMAEGALSKIDAYGRAGKAHLIEKDEMKYFKLVEE